MSTKMALVPSFGSHCEASSMFRLPSNQEIFHTFCISGVGLCQELAVDKTTHSQGAHIWLGE